MDGGASEIALAGLAVSVAATAASGAAQYESAQATTQQNQAAADANAAAADANATAATNQAAADAQQVAQQGAQLKARQVAAASGDGVDVNSGSLLDVEEDSSVNNELQQQLIKYRGQVSASQDYSQASMDALQGNLASIRGQSAETGAAISTIGGIAQAGASYYKSTLLTSGSSDSSSNPTIYA